MKPIQAILCIALFAVILGGSGCSTGNKDYAKSMSDPMLYWKTVKKLNDVVLENIFSPPVASRNYVYANIAAYEAMRPGDARFATLSGVIKHMPAMPAPDSNKKYCFPYSALVAFCKVGDNVTFSHAVMEDYIEDLKKYADSVGMPNEVQKNSLEFADSVAATITRWSKGDKYLITRGAERYTVMPDSEYRWVPTPPAYSDALEPKWGEIRLMIIDSASAIKVPAPPKFDMKDKNSLFYQEMLRVKNAGDSLTEEQKHMADFWDDIPFHNNVVGHVMYGTKKFSPPGHWMNINGIAAQQAKADFGQTVYGYMASSVALFDAFICCWHEKYTYNTVRPETMINKYIDANWRPHIETPPFPEYTCGHSTISAAAAEVLTSVYGDNFAYTDSSENAFGIKSRSFKSFRQAAEENIWGRFYGGIHLHNSCIVSNKAGREIGTIVAERLKVVKKG
jgi:PAP2 superfamily